MKGTKADAEREFRANFCTSQISCSNPGKVQKSFTIINFRSTGSSVSTVAGSLAEFKEGRGIEASFNYPTNLVLDCEGNILVADTGNHCIRRVNHAGGFPQLDFFIVPLFIFKSCFR